MIEMMNRIKFLMAFLSAALLASCGQQATEYEKMPEAINVGQLSGVELLPGSHRFILQGSTRYMRTAKTLSVELLETEIKQVFAVDNSQDLFEAEISGLDAGNYYVVVTSFDKDGNQSLTQTYNVDVYDESSASKFYPKRITSVEYDEASDAMVITWNTVEEAQSVLLEYTRSDGEKVSETVSGDVQVSYILDWADRSEISAVTSILPSSKSLDPIELAPVTATFPKVTMSLPSATFAEVNMPSDAQQGQYGGPTRQLWDGYADWSNQGYHSNDGVGVPHHVTFDLGVTAKLSSSTLFFRKYGDFRDWPPRRFQIWGHPAITEEGKTIADYDVVDTPTKDNDEYVTESAAAGWVLLCEYYPSEEELAVNFCVTAPLDEDQAVRYIRYRIVEGWKAPYTGPGMYGNCTEMNFTALKGSVQ